MHHTINLECATIHEQGEFIMIKAGQTESKDPCMGGGAPCYNMTLVTKLKGYVELPLSVVDEVQLEILGEVVQGSSSIFLIHRVVCGGALPASEFMDKVCIMEVWADLCEFAKIVNGKSL
jgi:hypothetical protein